MGSSLHDKIYLGRSAVLRSSAVRAAYLIAACSSIGLVWLAIRLF